MDLLKITLVVNVCAMAVTIATAVVVVSQNASSRNLALAAGAVAASMMLYGIQLPFELAAKYPELIRIGLHLTPPGSSENIILASNVPSKIGQKSDPEDLQAMRTAKPVVLREEGNFDVTLPLHDASGKIIGALGLTFKPRGGEEESRALARAKAMARELEKQITSEATLFNSAGRSTSPRMTEASYH